MNTTFVNIVKQIVDQQGEAILSEPQRLKGYVQDYAKSEPKEIRLAFGRCIEQGYYRVLKQTNVPEERRRIKPQIAQQMHNLSKLELPLCAEAVDILEAVLYGIPPSQSVPQTSMNPVVPPQTRMSPPTLPQAPFVQSAPIPQAVPGKKRIFPIIAFAALLIIVIVGLINRDKISSALNGWRGFKDFASLSRAANFEESLGVKLTEEEFKAAVALILLGSMFSDNISVDIVSGDNLTQKYNVSTGLRSRYNYLVKRGGKNDPTIYLAYFNDGHWVVISWKEE
jgi:hypothetical protein